MRKYMNIINRLLFGAVALAALSCTGNFEAYNRNPDQPSTIDRDVWDYIKSMQYNVIPTVKNQYQIVENVSGGAYGRYFAYAKSTDAGWNTGMFAFYRIANDWANPPYEVPMTNIYSNWRAIKAELEEPEDDYRMALAQIIRVAAMQRVTDIQGPIPYRTMENNDDLTAPYQSQEAVYGFMLEDLDHAVNVLETYITLAGTDVVAEAASADYVYNGNLAKWIRFANSLKLRLAMRISNVSPDAERYAEEAVAHPYGVIESNADNASLDVSQTNDQNPLRWLVEDYSDVHAAAEIVTYMKSFDDPRLSKYFNPAVRDSEYHGSRVGALQPVEGLLFASENQRPRPAHVDERRRSGLPEGRNGRQRMGRDGRRQDALRRGHPPFVRAVSGRKLHVLHHRHGRADRLFRSAQGQQLYAGHGLQRHRRMGRRPFGGKAAREDHHPEMDRPLSARNGGVGRAAPHGISAILPHAHQHQRLERA